jgi:hypothetical protein
MIRGKNMAWGVLVSAVLLAAGGAVMGDTWGWQGAGTAGNMATDPTDPTTQWNIASNWGGTLPEGKHMDTAAIYPTNAGHIYAATGNFFSVQVGGTSTEAALYVTDGVDFTSSMLLVGLGIFNSNDAGKFGRVIQTGGTVNIGVNPLELGFWPEGQGTYELRDGSLTTVGTNYCGRQGSGYFIQTGGVYTAETVMLGCLSGSSGTYELKGGRLVAEKIVMQENATFSFTGGKLDIEMISSGLTNSGGALVARRETYIQGDYIQTKGALEITLGEGTHDILDVLGSVNITGGNLDVVLDAGYAPMPGDTFTIISGGGSPVNLEFETIADGYRVYADGNDVVLQFVPEPATLSLLALGGLLAMRRRR